jgi:pilus assembly protein CpaE
MFPITVALSISTSDVWKEVTACLEPLPIRVVHEQAGIDDAGAFLEKIEQSAPDVVILDVRSCADVLPELIEQIRSRSSHPEVIAVHVSSSPETILGTIRAGAKEYIYPPCDPSLPDALRRLSLERQKHNETVRAGGKLIGIVSAKGGLGATTLACHGVAELQSKTKKDTLLVDFDMSAGIVRSVLKTTSRYSVLDACSNVQRLDSSFWRALVLNSTRGFDILGAPNDVSAKDTPTSAQIRHVLRFIRSQYDWTLIDFGRGRSQPLESACEELDELLLVTTAEVPALIRVKEMIEYLKAKRMNMQAVRLVINRMGKQPEVALPDLERLLDLKVFATIPNDYRALHEAYAEGTLLSPDSNLRRKIGAMFAKLAGVETPQAPPTPKRFFAAFF